MVYIYSRNTISYILLFLYLGLNIIHAHTVVTIPDTQFYTIDAFETYEEQTKWICTNKKKLDISAVVHLGDVVHNYNDKKEWGRAVEAMKFLDLCGINYTILPGNHDVGDDTDYSFYDEYFNSKNNDVTNIDYLSNIYYFPDNTKRNTFTHYKSMSYGILSLEYMPSLHYTYKYKLLEWINQILLRFEKINIILVSHFVTDDCSSYIQNDIYNIAKKHCNIKIILGGHVFFCDGQRTNNFINDCNKKVWAISSNYQHRIHGGNGYLRFYKFNNFDSVCSYTYSVTMNKYDIDDKSWFSLQNDLTDKEYGCYIENHYLLSGYFDISLLCCYFIFNLVVSVHFYICFFFMINHEN